MKRIGIVTHYYKSINYGGNLQAYALCKVLQSLGYNAEQIQTPIASPSTRQQKIKKIFRKPWIIFGSIKARIKSKITQKRKKPFIDTRQKKFKHFNQELIPHSEKFYTRESISESVNDYDVFITGSDQVWNFKLYNPVFFLGFVSQDKIKISYAASMAISSLNKEQQTEMRIALKDFKAISVREVQALELIKDLSPIEPEIVLDPTLLLTSVDWDKVCADTLVQEKYVFCYFLGNNKNERKIAEIFARTRGLTLVTVPMEISDKNFGDLQIDASPEEFLSLIKHAEYVFTDSFHAVVFSFLYQKQYFVFNRNKKGEMSTRITDITKLFKTEERFCGEKSKETIEYVTKLNDIDYSRENEKFEQLKSKSINFLKVNLEN